MKIFKKIKYFFDVNERAWDVARFAGRFSMNIEEQFYQSGKQDIIGWNCYNYLINNLQYHESKGKSKLFFLSRTAICVAMLSLSLIGFINSPHVELFMPTRNALVLILMFLWVYLIFKSANNSVKEKAMLLLCHYNLMRLNDTLGYEKFPVVTDPQSLLDDISKLYQESPIEKIPSEQEMKAMYEEFVSKHS